MTGWRRPRRVDGYAPIEDHGVIGDGTTAALVSLDGSISWLCVPRFDDPPLFAEILDAARGGALRFEVEGLLEASQAYEPDTGILVTTLQSSGGVLEITDALVFRSGADLDEDGPAARGELVRLLRVLHGKVAATLHVQPLGGAEAERRGDGLIWRRADGRELHLLTRPAVERVPARLELEPGDPASLVLAWGSSPHRRAAYDPGAAVDATRTAWKRWARSIRYDGQRAELVRRSAITLKMLDYFENGALVAAATSSLPEWLGGERNWDYRYSWVRDAAFSSYALGRLGLRRQATAFLGWVLDAVERDGRPLVLYDLDGRQPPREVEDAGLDGYRGSRPVRWGNGAATQLQLDAYGEILDVAYLWSRRGGSVDAALWSRLVPIIESAQREWRQPDHGIWEVRTSGRPFTYSAAMCSVALNRGARLAERLGLPGERGAWLREAKTIRAAILEEAWDRDAGSLTEHLGVGGGIDASLLALPLRGVLDARHPRMVATVEAVQEQLGAGGWLLYRYLPERSPDGLGGPEGAFLLSSFWLVDNLVLQGRLEQAETVFEALCARANHLGLLSEEIDPRDGSFLGNFPQAFSHVGLISSAVNLARTLDRERGSRADA